MPMKRTDDKANRGFVSLFTVKVKGVGLFDFNSKTMAKQFRDEKRKQGHKVYLSTGPDHADYKGEK